MHGYRLALIGGTGLESMQRTTLDQVSAATPYGPASAVPTALEAYPDVLFLNRHGDDHELLPHEINYRANVHLLKTLGVSEIVAVFAVGGIDRALRDGSVALPDQLIDYTWGREHTFFAKGVGDASPTGETTSHVDFSAPFDAGLRRQLAAAAAIVRVPVVKHGVYGATQGPRLETVAEIDRMARDGCTVVGMTGMPEAGLAREAGIRYAGICLVVNPAAGRGPKVLTVSHMRAAVDEGQPRLLMVLSAFLASRPGDRGGVSRSQSA